MTQAPILKAICEIFEDDSISDLHLVDGTAYVRKNGQLFEHPVFPIGSNRELDLSFFINYGEGRVNSSSPSEIERDYAFSIGPHRVRVNVCSSEQGVAVSIRRIIQHPPSVNELGLPRSLIEATHSNGGLILICGPTGSGKSTTLSALINYMNHNFSRKIVTLEEPIEFVHTSNTSLIVQREIPTHLASFSSGLRQALRQDPDVILIGEMRDEETISLALSAAETGHLIMATVHASSAAGVINRVVDSVSSLPKSFVRTLLANSLSIIVGQRLMYFDKLKSRRAVFEVLVNTSGVANVIREDRTHQLQQIIETSGAQGMQSFEKSIETLLSRLS